MQLLDAITVEQAKEFSKFSLPRGPRLHLILPALCFGMIFAVILGREYYREWKRKRRMRRYWASKANQSQS